MTTREFDLADILSVTLVRNVSPKGPAAFHEVVDFMCGKNSRDRNRSETIHNAAAKCQKSILRQHSTLWRVTGSSLPKSITSRLRKRDLEYGIKQGKSAEQINRERAEKIAEWVKEQKAIFSETLPISTLDASLPRLPLSIALKRKLVPLLMPMPHFDGSRISRLHRTIVFFLTV